MTVTYAIETKNDNRLVTKSNMLIEASYKLGTVEQKIILCLASNIQPTDSDFKSYTLPIKEFHKLLGLKGTPKYSELRATTKELMQKVFEIRIDKKVIQVAWLSYVAYNESQGTIEIRFDPFLKPYLLELKKNFTSYKLENVVKLKSSYAIRIYELLKQYEKLKERVFLLADLRKMLGAEDVYPAYGNFKQRVLVPAQKELTKKTDISFEIEEIKEGRRVEKVKFIITSKKKKDSQQLELFEGNLEEFHTQSQFAEEAKKQAMLMGFKLTDKVLNSWAKYGQAQVMEALETVKGKKDITNPIGYITTILKAGSSQTALEEPVTLNEQDILIHLIAMYRKSKEAMPDWFFRQKSIEELQQQFNLDEMDATTKFKEIQEELYSLLGVKKSDAEKMSEEEFLKEKEELEKMLKV